MSYVRVSKRENPFVQLDKEFIGNGKLSLKATGLLTYILSKPDNWQIRMKDIQKRFKDKETSVRSAMHELMEAGYVFRYRERKENGTFGDYIYEVYERPEYNPHFSPKLENQVQEKPKRDFPEQENPEQENHVYNNNDSNNNDFNNIEKEEEEEKLSQIIELVDKNISPINEVIVESLVGWMKKLDYEVIKEEISYCIKKGKGFVYLENMFKQDEEQGINSIESLLEKRKKYSKKKAITNKKTYNNKEKGVKRREVLPGWYDDYKKEMQEYESNISSDEDFDYEEEKRKLLEELKGSQK
jgi:predicted transcriptional regulator